MPCSISFPRGVSGHDDEAQGTRVLRVYPAQELARLGRVDGAPLDAAETQQDRDGEHDAGLLHALRRFGRLIERVPLQTRSRVT